MPKDHQLSKLIPLKPIENLLELLIAV